ncbi:lysine transporter LysE [Dietzia sp. HMSC21D01]|uniref:LysE family translocator n=2 Tax=Dietzia cinnamea TaxID=321318 RepID=A0AAW5Q3I1_9ACTN|nr:MULTISPECIES: LysE family translocator [Dietzia]MCT2028829.1 LysE family translocator [Dietzia cinnamea]MCT2032335.1 LysE family translocator [Dietzia cinnamea]MCT2074921.1 LysE family translocator [Dietzia cinnamea]MCT2106364.1 LysE family translocator [Dietzia cinnamea]MCT2108686.1 LysE family translocator [Dietzia cinnamea]
MTAAQLLGLFGVWAIAVVSPGPDVVVVLQRALAGRRHGVATALGIVAGLTVWLGAAFAGVATLVRVYPQIMTVLQVAGGLLLATLGVLGLRGWWRSRSAPTDSAPPTDPASPAPTEPAPAPQNPLPGVGIRYRDRSSGSRVGVADLVRRDVARGLATNLANPKALVFFGAVLTPFLRDEVSVAWSVALVAGMLAVALAWFAGLAMVASHRAVNERVGRLLPWVDLVASALFVAAGVAFVIAALV